MPSATFDDRLLAADLPGAIERGEIAAHFQPQVDLMSLRIVAVEALCRWTHPELGEIPPSVFIPVAEREGSIHALGLFMVDACCRAASEWHSRGLHLEVSVNVSATQLATESFFAELVATLERHELDAHVLTIEITETLPIADVPAVVVQLQKLRDLGLGISIDDFGAGHASLQQIESLPASELKLDLALVQDDSNATRALLTSVVGLVQDRGLRVVAEGVETLDDLARVRRLHVERGQGYLLGRPMPKEELEAVLT